MSDITSEYIREYLYSINKDDHDTIRHIREEAIGNNIPIIKYEVKELLELLLTMHKPLKILEIGMAVGYSSIVMSHCLGNNGRITTIEKSDMMIQAAKKNIKLANKEDVINILEGDAVEVVKHLEDTYDFIFLDAAKGQYITLLPYLVDLLEEGGLLVSDNVLQEGLIAKSKWSIARRQRTIHQNLRKYLWEINHHDKLKTTILSIGDGVTISYKL